MQPALILTELERALPAAELPVVLAALKEDELVWSTLQQEEFIRSIITSDSSTAAAWCPASLALKPLGERIHYSGLSADNIPGIDGGLRKQAVELLEATIKQGMPVRTLTDAGLLALALRERRRKMQSWRGIYEALTSIRLKSGQSLFDAWKTPLTCLYPIIPDGNDLLKSLLSQESFHPAIEWISHVLLSNPIEPDAQIELFFNTMSAYQLPKQVEWLRYLKRKGHSTLAASLASRILASNGKIADFDKDEFDPDRAEWSELSQKVLNNQVAATLHQFSGHPLQAEMHLEKTRSLLQHWLVGSTIQLASIGNPEGKVNKTVIEQCSQMLKQFTVSSNLIFETEFAFAGEPFEFSLSDSNCSTTALLKKMEQAKQVSKSGSSRQAQEIAFVAVQEWMEAIKQDPALLSGQYLFDLNPWPVLNQLVELGLYSDAIAVGEKFLAVRCEDTELMVWLSDLCHRIGEDEKAINTIYQVILLNSGKAETYRKLADYYEDRMEWSEAANVRRRILEFVPLPATDDLLSLARCSYGEKQYQDVITTCEKILTVDPDNGLGLTYLGMASLANGETEIGLAHLNKATLNIPENPLPWIQLAEAYKLGGESQRALETLRAAIITAPESSELHFAVGATCLETGLTSEALPFLRQSAKLDPESDKVGLALTETLLKLGHEPEALEVIEKTRANWPAHPHLAYLHAKILLDKNDIDSGISALEIALQADNPSPAWFILYAKTLIGEYDRFSASEIDETDKAALIKANKMIQKAVSIAPESFEAKLLLAEVLSLRGEEEAAYAAYLQIVELPEAGSPEWNWRVQAGLGKTALALQQTETALASLQNAVIANPESITLQRFLSQAHRQANLFESAQESARAALALAPDDISNLVWFAELMSSVNAVEDAADALRLASQISPDRVDLKILLADMLLKKGNLEECRLVLEQVNQLGKTTVKEIRQIAQTYLRLGDDAQALICMERAAAEDPDGSGDFLYELAGLYAKTERLDEALDTIQKAIRENPRRIEYYLFQSDIQDRSNRPQAAIASLEHVMRLAGAISNGIEANSAVIQSGCLQTSNDPEQTRQDLVAIHMRFAKLLQKVENLGSASYHAEKALELIPENLETRVLAVKLAMKQLLYEQADTLAEIPEGLRPKETATSDESKLSQDGLGELYGLQAEIAIEQGDFSKAAKLISAGLALAPQQPRLRAGEIRILAKNGEYGTGNEQFDELWSALNPSTFGSRSATTLRVGSEPSRDKFEILPAVANAALDLCRWNEGLELFERYTNQNPTEPRGLLLHAKGLVRAAEWQNNSEALHLYSHVGSNSTIDETVFSKFTQLISDAEKGGSNSEIDRWKARGELVFHPTSGAVRTLASQQISAEDISAMVLAMGRLANFDAARQVGEQYSNDAQVNFQLSLLELPNESAYLLDKALASAAINPKNPIYHVSVARMKELTGDDEGALESLEDALFYWPDEGLWQHWAGQLAARCGDYLCACEHYEKAYQQLPDSIEIASGLGEAYLATGKVDEAALVFMKAAKAAPENANLWLHLAEAQFTAGSYREALVSAETSARIDPSSSTAKVLCGEISFALGSESKALEMIRNALALDPANIRARLLTSKILSKKGQEKEALVEIAKAVETLPDSVDLQTEKVRLVYKLKGATEALKLILPLSQTFPNNEQLLALQAQASAEVGELGPAESTALQSIRLNPIQPALHRLLGNIYLQAGQLDKSVHHLSEAVRMRPEDADIYLELGDVYTVRREYPLALKTYQQAMNAAPEDFRPFYQSALVLRDGKDYPGAESMMRRASQLAPNDVNIRRQLGAIVALNLVQSCQEANT